MIGATSGIGYGLSEKFLTEGRKVVLVGRRKDLLEEFVRKYEGRYRKEMMRYYVFDVARLDEISSWVDKYTPSLFLKYPWEMPCLADLSFGI